MSYITCFYVEIQNNEIDHFRCLYFSSMDFTNKNLGQSYKCKQYHMFVPRPYLQSHE